jgi:hypothetical protein
MRQLWIYSNPKTGLKGEEKDRGIHGDCDERNKGLKGLKVTKNGG